MNPDSIPRRWLASVLAVLFLGITGGAHPAVAAGSGAEIQDASECSTGVPEPTAVSTLVNVSVQDFAEFLPHTQQYDWNDPLCGYSYLDMNTSNPDAPCGQNHVPEASAGDLAYCGMVPIRPLCDITAPSPCFLAPNGVAPGATVTCTGRMRGPINATRPGYVGLVVGLDLNLDGSLDNEPKHNSIGYNPVVNRTAGRWDSGVHSADITNGDTWTRVIAYPGDSYGPATIDITCWSNVCPAPLPSPLPPLPPALVCYV